MHNIVLRGTRTFASSQQKCSRSESQRRKRINVRRSQRNFSRGKRNVSEKQATQCASRTERAAFACSS
eukprot:2486300-Pleurochrysis_carterae.AAC.1